MMILIWLVCSIIFYFILFNRLKKKYPEFIYERMKKNIDLIPYKIDIDNFNEKIIKEITSKEDKNLINECYFLSKNKEYYFIPLRQISWKKTLLYSIFFGLFGIELFILKKYLLGLLKIILLLSVIMMNFFELYNTYIFSKTHSTENFIYYNFKFYLFLVSIIIVWYIFDILLILLKFKFKDFEWSYKKNCNYIKGPDGFIYIKEEVKKRILEILKNINYLNDVEELQININNGQKNNFVDINLINKNNIIAEINNNKINNKLLILRTYGNDEKTDFLYNFSNSWITNYGTVMAIIDKSFSIYEISSKNFSKKIIVIFKYIRNLSTKVTFSIILKMLLLTIILTFINIALFNSETDIINIFDINNVYYLISDFILLIVYINQFINEIKHIDFSHLGIDAFIDTLFISNEISIKEQLQEKNFILKKSFLGLRNKIKKYNFISFYCYNNIWKLALKDLVNNSNFIIMDLREYTKNNLGCSYEIGYLITNYNLEKLLIIVDKKTDIDYLKNILNFEAAKINQKVDKKIKINIYSLNNDINNYNFHIKNIVNYILSK